MEHSQVDVLIVDDDDAIRIMLRRALKRFNLVCSEARDGIEALQCLKTTDCAVILLDLMMPRLDGHGFVEQFALTRRAGQEPVIIAVSASGDDELHRVNRHTIHAVFRKPFDLHSLTEIVASCVAIRWAAMSAILDGPSSPSMLTPSA
jgi:two-component system, chemotaxis family, chemotaxis protein CheY